MTQELPAGWTRHSERGALVLAETKTTRHVTSTMSMVLPEFAIFRVGRNGAEQVARHLDDWPAALRDFNTR
jgi:hypothetical protein